MSTDDSRVDEREAVAKEIWETLHPHAATMPSDGSWPYQAADRILAFLAVATGGGLREEVLAFAWLMEEALRKHDGDRGPKGWQGDDYRALLARLEEESAELAAALSRLVATDSESFVSIARSADVGKEAADVGNFAMMIADVVGALVAPMHRLQPSGAADVGDARGVLGYVVIVEDERMVASGLRVIPDVFATPEEATSWARHSTLTEFRVAPVGSPGGDAPAERDDG